MAGRADGMISLLKAATPMFIGVAGVLLLALPLRIAGGAIPTPIIPLAVVFFWSLYGPEYLPAPSVFFIGLLQDFLCGGPLGMWPAVYLVAQYAVLSQRSYFLGRDQQVVWIGFASVAAGATLMLWIVMSLMSRQFLPIGGALLQMLATVAVFPLFSAGFRRLHRRVIVEA